MNLLENELVRKYFGKCEHGETEERAKVYGASAWHRRVCMAEKVLQAMQQQISDGERMLAAFDDGISEQTASKFISGGPWPRSFLRLPDRFQTKTSSEKCPYEECCMHKNQPAPERGTT